MLVLAKFWPLLPEPGLLLWTTVIFFLFWTIVGKKAFKPIAEALEKREGDIESALKEAEKARLEMADLKSQNDQILAEAREERSKILKEAKEMSKNMIQEAKDKAQVEAKKIMTNANAEIENKKVAAMIDVKNQAGLLALDIAEKVIKKDLKGDNEHVRFVNDLVNEIKLN